MEQSLFILLSFALVILNVVGPVLLWERAKRAGDGDVRVEFLRPCAAWVLVSFGLTLITTGLHLHTTRKSGSEIPVNVMIWTLFCLVAFGWTWWMNYLDRRTPTGQTVLDAFWARQSQRVARFCCRHWHAFKQHFQPSQTMNYRIFIPSIILALIAGVLLHAWLGERYRFQAIGNGAMIKTDRWTGEAWRTSGYSQQWSPVR